MGLLTDRTALVTGGSSGIGKEIARRFLREGARVAITGRNGAALDAACAELGGVVTGILSDVADLESHAALAGEVGERFGRLDILVCNAGVISLAPTPEVTPAEFDQQFGVNVRGLFFSVQRLMPLVRDGGSITLIGSLAATKVLENHAVYAGTKAAIGAFARNWALELRDRRIRVNVLSPGPVETPILGKLGIPEAARPGFVEQMGRAIPAGRLGRPEDIAAAALFLASDAAAFVNGVNLLADGGMALT